MAKKTYYELLGLSKTASEKEIRAAYRKLARKYHPDVSTGDKKAAEAKFKEINEAYRVLSVPDSRKKYNEYGENWKHADRMAGAGARTAGSAGFGRTQPGRAGGAPRGAEQSPFEGGGFDFGDIFGQFGSGGRRQAFAVPGQDIEQPIEVTLEEAFNGTTRIFQIANPASGVRRLEVKIPAGVKMGSRVRMAAEGGPGAGGAPNGDVWLVVTVRPHAVFERDGDDLKVDALVSLVSAMLGGEAEVPKITGGKLALKVPPETQNGRVFRLRGQGMARLDGGRGDLLARMNVVLPEHLSSKERELFEQLKSMRDGR